AGVVSYDVSQLYGYVRGYVAGDVGEARAALEPLMLRFGFDGIERDGTLVFRMRDGLNPALVSEEMVAVDDEIEALFERTREADAVIAGRVRLRFVEADADFDIVAEEGLLPDEATHAVATSELAMALTKGEGRGITERWLAEARVARDAARFALPPSRLEVGAGDVVALPNAPGERRDLYRVDRVEQGPHQVIEAVRIEPSIYNQVDLQEVPASRRAVPGPVPVNAFFMDLPLILGTEAEAVPHVAASADPWPGSVAVYRSQSGEDFRLDTLVNGRAVIGVTQNPLFPACMGRPDRGDGLDVVLQSGALESVTDTALAAGANLMAIGDGTPGGWELFQVRDVELIAPQTYRLRHRLRGQAGTEALAAEFWPAGSYVVLMNGLPLQLDNTVTWRFVSQTLRVGPAAQPLDAAAYRQVTHTFEGLSLRPYAPVHVRADVDAGGVEVSWIRRTRVEGDAWDLADVPLGESRELYQVSVLFGGVVVREVQVAEPGWVYSAADMAADGVAGGFAVRVAQVSERFGPGPAGVVSVAA
ncbi:MAG: phage tail protein, partial [Pseudomonadota bacterium]